MVTLAFIITALLLAKSFAILTEQRLVTMSSNYSSGFCGSCIASYITDNDFLTMGHTGDLQQPWVNI